MLSGEVVHELSGEAALELSSEVVLICIVLENVWLGCLWRSQRL